MNKSELITWLRSEAESSPHKRQTCNNPVFSMTFAWREQICLQRRRIGWKKHEHHTV